MTNSTLTRQIPDWTEVEFEGLSEIYIVGFPQKTQTKVNLTQFPTNA